MAMKALEGLKALAAKPIGPPAAADPMEPEADDEGAAPSWATDLVAALKSGDAMAVADAFKAGHAACSSGEEY